MTHHYKTPSDLCHRLNLTSSSLPLPLSHPPQQWTDNRETPSTAPCPHRYLLAIPRLRPARSPRSQVGQRQLAYRRLFRQRWPLYVPLSLFPAIHPHLTQIISQRAQIANRANEANGVSPSPGPSSHTSHTSHTNGFGVDSTASALARAGLAEHPGLLRNFQSGPSRPNAASSRPGMVGMAAKRKRPALHLADILDPESEGDRGGGASGAGLGAGRPNGFEQDAPAKRIPPQMAASPFSNFDKIV